MSSDDAIDKKLGKEIRIQFVDLEPEAEQTIRAYLKEGIVSGTLKADDHSNTIFAKSQREYVRVFLENCVITMRTPKSEKLESQEISCRILNISQGGLSIQVEENTKLAKNSVAEFSLDFLEPALVVQGRILGLQYE